MKYKLFHLLLFINIYNSFEQNENNKKNDNNEKNKSKKLKIFLLQMGSIVLFIILIYLIMKLCVKLCKKRFAFNKLLEEFSKNKLLSEKAIDQIKYIYGLNYVISFLKEKIFISCKFNDKNNILKNCGNCSICLGSFSLDEKIFITSCNHVYHDKCMTDYLDLIVKDINPNEGQIENFHNYFQCPNCKEFLFINRAFLKPSKKEEKNIDNINEINNEEHKKGGDIFVVSAKSKSNINNFISTEASSKRNLSRTAKKQKKHIHKKGQNKENANNKKNNNEIADTQIIEVENIYKSDMKLKDNMAFQESEKIDKPNSKNENASDIQSQISKDSQKTNIDKEVEIIQ